MFDGNKAFWKKFYKDTVKYGKCFEIWEDQSRDQTFEMRGYLMMYGDQTWAISMFLKDVTQTVKNTRYMELLNQDLERCAKERVRETEDAYRELDRFTHTVSHEFKTPLRAIEAYNQILREEEWDKLDEEGCQAVNEIARLCDNTLHMISSLLEHSKMKFKQLQLGLVDMNRLVEEVFQEIVVVKQGEKPKLIQYHLPYAVADEFLMKQVIYNIFSNSIKFAKAGETAVLTVGAISEKQQNTYYFADNGVGFDMKYSGKLFTMFNRLHSSSEYEGNGIGLYTIKYIVEKHGGTVFIESEENKGCVIGFSLPK